MIRAAPRLLVLVVVGVRGVGGVCAGAGRLAQHLHTRDSLLPSSSSTAAAAATHLRSWGSTSISPTDAAARNSAPAASLKPRLLEGRSSSSIVVLVISATQAATISMQGDQLLSDARWACSQTHAQTQRADGGAVCARPLSAWATAVVVETHCYAHCFVDTAALKGEGLLSYTVGFFELCPSSSV